jgi:glycerol-3-phosphate cytidylyltransferase
MERSTTPLSIVEQHRNTGKIIGFTSSAFDLFHAGHVAMLAEAHNQCDFLIVGLLVDPTRDRPDSKRRPVQSVFERWIMCQACDYVDLLVPFETEKDLVDMLLLLKPHKRFVGEEYKGKEHTGWNIPDIDIIYNSRLHSFSSSELRERVLALHKEKLQNEHLPTHP